MTGHLPCVDQAVIKSEFFTYPKVHTLVKMALVLISKRYFSNNEVTVEISLKLQCFMVHFTYLKSNCRQN